MLINTLIFSQIVHLLLIQQIRIFVSDVLSLNTFSDNSFKPAGFSVISVPCMNISTVYSYLLTVFQGGEDFPTHTNSLPRTYAVLFQDVLKYLDSNYFNIIETDIPYEQFVGGGSSYLLKTMFYRSHTTNKGERKITILKRENGHIDIYSLKIEDNRDKGIRQKAVMEGKIAEISCAGKSYISFFDTIDFRSLATNKETFKKIDTLQSSYAVIGCYDRIFLTNLENGYNIDLIIYGAPYMFITKPEQKDVIGFPSIEQGKSESETTWNSWSKGGSVSIEAGVSAGGKAGIVDASASVGIYASIAHQNSKKFTNTTKITTSVENAFLNDELRKDWSVGSVYFSSSSAEYTGYCYLGFFNNNPYKKLPSDVFIKGLEQCRFSMIVPYIAMKPKSKSLSYNYYSNKTNKRIDTWESIDKAEAKTIGMLTAGIADSTFGNGSKLIITGGDSRSKIREIVKWQKEKLNLDSFFDAGNDNEKLQKKNEKSNINFTGVVKGVGSERIDSTNMWGLRYSVTDKRTLDIEQTHTRSMQKETDFAFGFNHSCSVSVAGIGGYSNISAGINGSYGSGTEGSTTKYFSLKTVGGTKTGDAGLAVADVNVGLFKAWLRTKNKPLNRPGWISEYAWENNSHFTAVIPFLWEGCLHAEG